MGVSMASYLKRNNVERMQLNLGHQYCPPGLPSADLMSCSPQPHQEISPFFLEGSKGLRGLNGIYQAFS